MDQGLMVSIMVYAGSAIMVYNIIRYILFARFVLGIESYKKSRGGTALLVVPLILLILFLMGYILVGVLGNPDIIMAGILLGGSVFVLLITRLSSAIAKRIRANDEQLEAMYDSLKSEFDAVAKDKDSVVRVNLSKDEILSVSGSGLYASDTTAGSYTDFIDGRRKNVIFRNEEGSGSVDLTRDGLLKKFESGYRDSSEVLFVRRSDGSDGFVKLDVAMTLNPSTGDIEAFISESDHDTDMVCNALINSVLSSRCDMVARIVGGQFSIVTKDHMSGYAVPGESMDYGDYLTRYLYPELNGPDTEKSSVLDSVSLASIERALEKRSYYSVDFACGRDSVEGYRNFTFYPVDKRAGFYILLQTDITDSVKDQMNNTEKLRQALKGAEAANKAKTMFLSNMSHDIRTPLNAIIGYTNLARNAEAGSDEIGSYLEKIDASGKHLLSLIDDVLEMSRIESGRMDVTEEPSDLNMIVSDIKDMLVNQMSDKGIDFTVETDCSKSTVMCDENRLKRILLNLLSNAYKFTPEGGSVRFTLSQKDSDIDNKNMYEFRVKDTGSGMSEEFVQKIYEPFERAETATVSGIQGTGLGMSITKSLVDMMGGTISIDTAPGQGTDISLFIGFTPVLGGFVSGRECTFNGPGIDFNGKKILLVEDIDINREIAEILLRDMGFTVETAVNGKEALDLVSGGDAGIYDAVLMDVQMPVMDGYEATRAIRSLDDPAKANVPVIAMTANAFKEDILNATAAGMNGHIPKPIDPEVIKCVLSRVLSER